jgi:glutamate synthase domain-containing protein 3
MHGCEDMTGGKIVVLGRTGENFASGMSGGMSFILDEDGGWPENCNTQIEGTEEEKGFRDLIAEDAEATRSKIAARVLQDWAGIKAKFWAIVPKKT